MPNLNCNCYSSYSYSILDFNLLNCCSSLIIISKSVLEKMLSNLFLPVKLFLLSEYMELSSECEGLISMDLSSLLRFLLLILSSSLLSIYSTAFLTVLIILFSFSFCAYNTCSMMAL